MSAYRRNLFFILALIVVSFNGHSADLPMHTEGAALYEFRVLGATAYLPDYPGSARSRQRFIAAPFVIYRGQIFRADQQEGARAYLHKSPNWTLDLSASGSFPSHSAENPVRSGMPDLDWIGELGPRLAYTIIRFSDTSDLRARTSVRAVFSSDLSTRIRHTGFIIPVGLSLHLRDLVRKGLLLDLQLTSNFIDHGVAEYFYEVPSRFATDSRKTYTANSGYMGSDLSFGFHAPLNSRLELFGNAKFSFLAGSTNEASPLFEVSQNNTVLIGLDWAFHVSSEKERP